MLEPRVLLLAIAEELGLELNGHDYRPPDQEINRHLLEMAAGTSAW